MNGRHKRTSPFISCIYYRRGYIDHALVVPEFTFAVQLASYINERIFIQKIWKVSRREKNFSSKTLGLNLYMWCLHLAGFPLISIAN